MRTPHLSPEELIDLVDETLPVARARHVERCPLCRERGAALRTTMGELRLVDAPEPEPRFWDEFRARVRRLTTEAAPPPGVVSWWAGWWARPAAALVVASVVLVIAAGATLKWFPRRDASPAAPAPAIVGERAELPAVEREPGEPEWSLLLAMTSETELPAEALGGAWPPGATERAAIELLSPAEQRELARLLQAELNGVL